MTARLACWLGGSQAACLAAGRLVAGLAGFGRLPGWVAACLAGWLAGCRLAVSGCLAGLGEAGWMRVPSWLAMSGVLAGWLAG